LVALGQLCREGMWTSDLQNEWTGNDVANFELRSTMSMAADQPKRADEASDQSGPGLTDDIQRHIGNLLAAAYAQDDTELSATSRFAELLAKLDAAFDEAAGRNDAEVKKLLLAVLPALHRFAVSLARDPTAADDLVQDTLMRAWRSRTRFEPGTNFEAWTFTILRNTFYTGRRRQREVQDEDGSYTARLTTPPEQGGHLDLQDVRAALDRLAPVMRESLVLVAIENLSYEEAAAVMNCQIGTVKSRVWRAREHLARMLGYTGAEVGSDGVMLSALGGSGEVSE
jgi:RNA polymerase sigma-70 factor (ECF subfamily)